MRAEGRQSEADHIANDTVFSYFWKQTVYNRYCDKMKKELEKSK